MKKVILCLAVILMGVQVMAQTYSGGSGTSGDPYQIANKADLKYLSENSGEWTKHFRQTADIVFADADFLAGGDFYNGGVGFIPIGTSTPRFSGSYNGDGYTISNLYINQPYTDFIGFFGYTDAASISGIGLENVEVIGDYRTGGLVGRTSNSTNIFDCYCSGDVTGNAYTGMFVGQNYGGSTISRSYSTGTVTNSGAYTGGIAGDNWGSTISNCYSRSTVNGANTTGGLVGRNGTGSMISDCYSTGSVSGGTNTGGLIGDNLAGDAGVENSFWNLETSGQASSAGGAGATGKTIAEMQDHTTYTTAGWDFKGIGAEGIWNIGNGRNDGYPYFDWQHPEDTPLPVTLSSFTGICSDGIPQLNWTTQSETGNSGWNIYRSESENGWEQENVIQCNPNLIPGQGTTSQVTNYSYQDVYDLVENANYYYWLQSVGISGEMEIFGPVSILVEWEEEPIVIPDLPADSYLSSNFPNPFNPATIIEFGIKEGEEGNLSIYNILGQKVLSQKFAAGFHTFSWDAAKQASGIYFYRLQTPTYHKINKALLLK